MPLAIERGAEPVEVGTGVMELHIPAIRGIGHSLIYLVDRYGDGLQHLGHRLRLRAGRRTLAAGRGLPHRSIT